MKAKAENVIFSSETDEWGTPNDLFIKLDKQYNFTLDVAASNTNYKCKKYYTKEDNGLFKDWSNEVVWCNPPYSEIDLWVQKCYEEADRTKLIIMLIPVRTDTRYFHKYIYGKAELVFIKGRLKYTNPHKNGSSPFPSMLVIFKEKLKLDNQIQLF